MKILRKSISTQTIGENPINVRKETLGQDDASQKVVGSNPVLAKDFLHKSVLVQLTCCGTGIF